MSLLVDNTNRTCTLVPDKFHVPSLLLGCSRTKAPALQLVVLIDIPTLFPASQKLHIRYFPPMKDVPTTFKLVPPQKLPSLLRLSINSVRLILQWLQAFDHLPIISSLALPPLQIADAPFVHATLQKLRAPSTISISWCRRVRLTISPSLQTSEPWSSATRTARTKPT
ncbi:hypothetical protein K438DRAFT_1932893 [Mycena galopus ATCC 62051]|nr:hypothetical protein K438DRAFT_1932893 [Mycena galopus ATCC 62051]